MTKIDKIKELIEKDGLVTKSRHRYLVDKRNYMFNALREEGFTFQKIGEIFERNHATIINGIKKHKQLTKHKDYDYIINTKLYKEELESDYIEPRSIEDDVLRCQDLKELKLIQERILMGKYF